MSSRKRLRLAAGVFVFDIGYFLHQNRKALAPRPGGAG
jgi:hypothetical protein